MQDRPTVEELLAAVRAFLEDEVVPALDGRRRFHALVAANVLGIVGRQLAREPDDLAAEWRRLAALLGAPGEPPADAGALHAAARALTETLCARIRAGDADAGPFAVAVRAHLEATARAKLAVDNPRLLDGSARR
jgi:uncharacterized protein DUF6285